MLPGGAGGDRHGRAADFEAGKERPNLHGARGNSDKTITPAIVAEGLESDPFHRQPGILQVRTGGRVEDAALDVADGGIGRGHPVGQERNDEPDRAEQK